jgi:hypothetical protein
MSLTMTARLHLSHRPTLALAPPRWRLGKPAVTVAERGASSVARSVNKLRKPSAAVTATNTGPAPLPLEGCLLRIRLPFRLTNENAGQGHHWGRKHAFRDECETQLRAWQLGRVPFDHAVSVHVIRVLGPRERRWDSSSGLRGNYKAIEDALVTLGWFHDDGPQWIARTTFEQLTTDREHGPAILIEIRDATC